VGFADLPEELTPGVRPGFVMVHGREPHAGERVWLTQAACYQVYVDGWWLVERVEAAYVPEFTYLHAVRAGDPRRTCQRLYAAIMRLHVERADPRAGRPHPAADRGTSLRREATTTTARR
jgi:hypothetical protein